MFSLEIPNARIRSIFSRKNLSKTPGKKYTMIHAYRIVYQYNRNYGKNRKNTIRR